MKSISSIVLLVAAAAPAIAAAACAHTPTSYATPSYTAAQAEAGGKAYRAACVGCHMSDLRGGGDAAVLAGPSFTRRWDGHPIGELTGYMREHMPRTFPGLLNERTYLALAAYLLEQNGVPPGKAAVGVDSTWPIRIESH